jgi:hypothetical protein
MIDPDPSRAPGAPRPSWRPLARADVVFRRVGEDWVLFDPTTQQIHVLNLTAALVWSFCTGEMEVENIEQEVSAAFGQPPPDDTGVAKALGAFEAAGLLVTEP